MATAASTGRLISAIPMATFQQRKLLSAHPCLKQRCSGLSIQISCSPSNMNPITAQFKIPDEVKVQLATAKARVWQYVPRPVKDLPWKKASDVFLEQLICFAQDVLKWSFVAWFCSSFALDIIFAVSRNQELITCLALFLGCLWSDFRMELFKDLFPKSEVKDMRWDLVVVGCFCIALKLIASAVAVRGQLFLLHVANGGLMQLLWVWRRLLKDEQNLDQENV
ncbi:hypothetical protein AKJ16_DCAP15177 [Drosera capensis]